MITGRSTALDAAIRRPRLRPYASGYERALRPWLATTIAPDQRVLILLELPKHCASGRPGGGRTRLSAPACT